jgi:DMSO/TMAO reductase YedYZ heme-binding membrane subunit
MTKLLFDFIQLLNTLAPLLMSLAVLTFIFLLLAKSIKKHAAIYYFVFAIPAILFILRQLFSSCGIAALEFSRGSVIGSILREYVHASGFSLPLLIIIMYIGALPAQNRYVKQLMMIRKELSIISGFPILIHAWVRLRMGLGAFDYFFGSGEAVRSGVGAGFSNAVYMLGIFMAILFIILWVTSFDAVHKRLGSRRWKKVQQWSYVLYAMLFIHAMGIQVNSILNPRGGREAAHPAVEVPAVTAGATGNLIAENQGLQQRTERSEEGNNNAVQATDRRGNRAPEAPNPAERSNRSESPERERGNRHAVQPGDGSNPAEATNPAERSNRSESPGRERGNRNAVRPGDGSNHSEEINPAERSNRSESTGRERGNRNAVQPGDGSNPAEATNPAERINRSEASRRVSG